MKIKLQTVIINYPDSPYANHASASIGNYTMKLSVTTANSCSNFKMLSITIYSKPQANFESAAIRCQFMPIQFIEYSQAKGGASIVTWLCNFCYPGSGASNTLILQNLSHIFTTTGIFYVSPTATNISVCNDLILKPVTKNTTHTAQFAAATGCIGNPTHFTDGSIPSSVTLIAWEWNFVDTGTITVLNPCHTYTTSGNYDVKLKVMNLGGCQASIIQRVFACSNPLAYYTFINFFCPAGTVLFQVQFHLNL